MADYHPAVETQLQSIEETRQRVLASNEDVCAIAAAIDGLTVGPRAPEINVYFGVGTHNSIVLTCWDVDNLADLTPLFRRLRKAGWKASEPRDEPETRRRAYTLTLVGTDRTARLQVFTSWSDGAQCRWVQKGVKEEPVYELVCGEDGGVASA